jgi:hypothetical protein
MVLFFSDKPKADARWIGCYRLTFVHFIQPGRPLDPHEQTSDQLRNLEIYLVQYRLRVNS